MLSTRLSHFRCNYNRIKMKYKISFRGYVGECQGTLVPDSEDGERFTRNLMIVTIVCASNSTILILVVVFLVCRKWRIRSNAAKMHISESSERWNLERTIKVVCEKTTSARYTTCFFPNAIYYILNRVYNTVVEVVLLALIHPRIFFNL